MSQNDWADLYDDEGIIWEDENGNEIDYNTSNWWEF